MLTDLRYAARQILKAPAFAAVAILTLALGIGANTAIFSVTNAVLLRALPYPDPDRIVSINKIEHRFGIGGLTAGTFLDFREQSVSFEHLAAYSEEEFTLTGSGDAMRVVCGEVSSDLFPLLGVKPILGRTFFSEEEQVGHDQVVVVSESFWRRQTGGDPGFLGKTITLNDAAYTVIGVMPSRFQFPHIFEIWKPLALDPEQERHGKSFTMVHLIGRLKTEMSLAGVETELNTIWKRRPSEEPDVQANDARIEIVPLHEQLVKDVRQAIVILLGTVALVLFIACANVANLTLARSTVRRKEIAIRAALGARRSRIIAQLLTESVLLSVLGGALGLLLAVWGVDLLMANIPADLAGSLYGVGEIAIDRRVLIYTIVVSGLTGILFGLVPALTSSKVDLNEALKNTSKTVTSRSRLRGILVVSQIALTLVLLVGAGLMARSFIQLMNVKLGFNQEKILTFRVELPTSRYPNGISRRQFFGDLLERLKSVPAVQSIGAISQLPLSGYSMMGRFVIEGQPKPEPGRTKPIPLGMVASDYFQTMQIPLLQGRLFGSTDIDGMPQVAIVNEAFAHRYWPGENPIGKKIGAVCDKDVPCRSVVGTVGDVRHEGLALEAQPEVFVPYSQISIPGLSVLVRTEGDPLVEVAAVRSQVRALDRDQPIALVQTLKAHVSESVLQPRLMMTLLSIFGLLALVLAAVGVYGMLSYSISQRRSEIGIRIALGAAGGQIFRLVVGQAMLLVAAGLIIGLSGAMVATRWLGSLLFEVSVLDPFTFVAIALLLAFVSLLAAWLPARRATKISPMTALRSE